VDARVRAAIDASHLRGLPGDVLDELMDGAASEHVSAGSYAHREGETIPLIELVVSGTDG
jgi:CRP/FNR family transcriptional regulator, cyclic AMP receptor protein